MSKRGYRQTDRHARPHACTHAHAHTHTHTHTHTHKGTLHLYIVEGATAVEHDHNFLQFMDITKLYGLALNAAKCDIKCNKVSFFDQLYTSEGIKTDPQNVKDLREMPVGLPTTKAERQHFFSTPILRNRVGSASPKSVS